MVGKDAEIDAGCPRKERGLDFWADNCDCRGDTVVISEGQRESANGVDGFLVGGGESR